MAIAALQARMHPRALRAVRDALSDVDSRDSERTLGVLGKIALV